jgi:mRNA interferase RelE/StbE
VSWDYSFKARALKELKKLDHQAQVRIIGFLDATVKGAEDPRSSGKPLKGELGNLWRYRVGDFRILCQMHDERLVVLVVRLGHRRQVYR